ncbi:MAG: trehalase family glycosidase [Rickettsiales bacterium]|nr:trehalase family glycosidase [Rickettsiales bacterium]
MSSFIDTFVQLHVPEFLQGIMVRSEHEELIEVEALQLELKPARDYIHDTWKTLIRTHMDLYLEALFDPKVPRDMQATRLLYIAHTEDEEQVRENLKNAKSVLLGRIQLGTLPDVTNEDLPEVEIRRLSPLSQPLELQDHQHSLMYLPYPYVVPGPRFNEMYNWDTAFVVRGLLKDKKFDLAKAFVENMFYQIEHYGTILNGNRTYYYDSKKSRSQPPLLMGKVCEIYKNYHQLCPPQEESKHQWLKRALVASETYYQHWVTAPHIHEQSSLSMYNSELGDPAFEVIHSEKSHYDKALSQLRAVYEKLKGTEQSATADYQDRKDRYYLHQYYVPAQNGQPDSLSEAFYRGDRAMRETGFDPSRRFGFFNVDVINYLPVCLNSLRYKMEHEMAEMYRELVMHEPDGKNAKGQFWSELSSKWEQKAVNTAKLTNEWLWDEGQQDDAGNWIRKPCYHDYNVNDALCKKYDVPQFREYDFVTSFYPMWVGIASEEQAALLVEHLLPRLQTEWGIMTSSRQTGGQWDKPFMWAPLVVIAVEALERYGYYQQALEIACGFLKMIAQDFKRTGKLYEKYDALRGTSDVSKMVEMGYSENVEGFAWTNSAVLELTETVHRINAQITQT